MNREVHVRICERLGAQVPGPTRPSGNAARVELRTHLATERERVITLCLKQTRPGAIPTIHRTQNFANPRIAQPSRALGGVEYRLWKHENTRNLVDSTEIRVLICNYTGKEVVE
jgi:hypothetical protein